MTTRWDTDPDVGDPGRRRILIVMPSLEGGGAERFVTHLLRGLPPRRFDLHLALVRTTGPYLADLPGWVTLHDLGSPRIRRAAWPLVRRIWRLRPHVVLSTNPGLNLVLLALRPLLPRATTVVSRSSNLLRNVAVAEGYSTLWWRLSRLAYRNAAVIVCPAGLMADEFVQRLGVPAGRIARIPNPVDTAEVVRRAADGGSPYPGPGPHLVAIGRLAREKGFDRVIPLLPRFPAAHLWILGRGGQEGALREEAARHGVADRVHFRGFERNPYRWLRHADLFVQPSRFEGSPNALLEALACGTRVVAFDSPGGTREILEGLDGTALVPDGDADAFAAAVERMLSPSRPSPPALPARHAYATVLAQYERLLSGDGGVP